MSFNGLNQMPNERAVEVQNLNKNLAPVLAAANALHSDVSNSRDAVSLVTTDLRNALNAYHALPGARNLNHQLHPMINALRAHGTPPLPVQENVIPDSITLLGSDTEEGRKKQVEEILAAITAADTLLRNPNLLLERLDQEQKTRNALDSLQLGFMSEQMGKLVNGTANVLTNPEAGTKFMNDTFRLMGMQPVLQNGVSTIATQGQRVQENLNNLAQQNGLPPPPNISVSQSNMNTGNQLRQTILGTVTQLFAGSKLGKMFGGDNPSEAAEKFVDGLMSMLGELIATHMTENSFLNGLIPRGLGEDMMFASIVRKKAQETANAPTQQKARIQEVIEELRMTPEMQSRLLRCVRTYCALRRQNKPVTDKPEYALCESEQATAKYIADLEAVAKANGVQGAVTGVAGAIPDALQEAGRKSVQTLFPNAANQTLEINATDATASPQFVQLRGRNIRFYKQGTGNTQTCYVRIENGTATPTVLQLETANGRDARQFSLFNPNPNPTNDPELLQIRTSDPNVPNTTHYVTLGNLLTHISGTNRTTHNRLIVPTNGTIDPNTGSRLVPSS